jgi:hypothetical protein
MNSLFQISQDVEDARDWAKRVATTIQKQRKEIYYKDIGNGDIATYQEWLDAANDNGWDLNEGFAFGYFVEVVNIDGVWEEC